MTKLIAILIVLIVLFGAWKISQYYENVKNEREQAEAQAAPPTITEGQLSGLPQTLEASLQAARQQGATGLTNWLKTYGSMVQDPRRAWIELDYCVMIARNNPAEARKIFAAVKERTPPTSPIWPRIKQLQQTYE